MAKPPSQVSLVRTDKPPYIVAFERFTQANPDRIEAYVAFGLFISSEYEWASKQGSWPSDEDIAHSYRRMLHDTEVEKTIATANKAVDEHRRLLVTAHEEKYLDKMWTDIQTNVESLVTKSSHRQFRKGVVEATVGAFFWMVICIVIASGAALMGIDLLHAVTNIAHKPAPVLQPSSQPDH